MSSRLLTHISKARPACFRKSMTVPLLSSLSPLVNSPMLSSFQPLRFYQPNHLQHRLSVSSYALTLQFPRAFSTATDAHPAKEKKDHDDGHGGSSSGSGGSHDAHHHENPYESPEAQRRFQVGLGVCFGVFFFWQIFCGDNTGDVVCQESMRFIKDNPTMIQRLEAPLLSPLERTEAKILHKSVLKPQFINDPATDENYVTLKYTVMGKSNKWAKVFVDATVNKKPKSKKDRFTVNCIYVEFLDSSFTPMTSPEDKLVLFDTRPRDWPLQ